MRNDKIYARNNKNYKSKVSTFELGDYCLKRMLYWLGIVFELLLACLVAEVCQASNVFPIRKEPLSMTQNCQNLCDGQITTHFSQCLTFLTCSRFLFKLFLRPLGAIIYEIYSKCAIASKLNQWPY